MSEKSNAERFLDAFASVESSLNRILHRTDYMPYATLIKVAGKSNRLIRNNYEELREYGELRNAIVHHRSNRMEIVAQPCNSVTERMEHFAEQLRKDQMAITYASRPVSYADPDMSAKEVFEIMQKHHTSKVPVYENGNFLGMISLELLTSALFEGTPLKEKARDLLSETVGERVLFFDERRPVDDVIAEFEQAAKHQKKMPVILITKNGNKLEEPIGLISSSDLSRFLVMVH